MFLDSEGFAAVLTRSRQEDVTQTMYQDTKRSKAQLSGFQPEVDQTMTTTPITTKTTTTTTITPSTSKINGICDAVLKALLPRKSTNLQNIITAHVCKSPPALDDGLRLVAELMLEDEKWRRKP